MSDMRGRSYALQSVISAASTAFQLYSEGEASHRAVDRAVSALSLIGEQSEQLGSRLPVCTHLDSVLTLHDADPTLDSLLKAFAAVEQQLVWRRRATYDARTASANFLHGHANAMIVGPGGLENRDDVWLGVSLLAPGVRYPDHSHPPEEVYLVLSQGDFRQEEDEWFSPGFGGSLYNRPGIKHAMRSLGEPLFAFWLLNLPVY